MHRNSTTMTTTIGHNSQQNHGDKLETVGLLLEMELPPLHPASSTVGDRKKNIETASKRTTFPILSKFHWYRWSIRLVIIITVVILSILSAIVIRSNLWENNEIWISSVNAHHFQSIVCPTTNLSTFNFNLEDAIEDYLDPRQQPEFDENFSQTFRDHKFDGWSRTFTEFKESMMDFKTQYFVPYLQNGDRIYESACGIGLNLYMTLEILQEKGNISDIAVYGNEYLEENANRANWIIETLVNVQEKAIPRNHLGGICHGDSSNLSYVPANSFDLVFTGYISPLWDPLEFHLEDDGDRARMKDLCKHARNNSDPRQWQAKKLTEIMQERQEDWFSNWFQQMIRIAKSGAPVIVEEIALPFCEEMGDWGGVSREFWESGVERYGWDVNKSTLLYGSRSDEYADGRYNIFFLKNNV